MNASIVFWFALGNFLSTGLVWAYVARRYPHLKAAAYWSAGSLIATTAPAIGLFRPDSLGMMVAASTTILAFSLSAAGIRRFYDRPMSWITTTAVVSASCAALLFFRVVIDDYPMRIAAYSIGQAIPVAWTLPLLLARSPRCDNRGAQIAAGVSILLLVAFAARAIAGLFQLGHPPTVVMLDGVQGSFMLLVILLGTTWNYGLLMMAIDRLRGDVAELALVDDLTGVGNRRRLQQRLDDECGLAQRTRKPFALLAIDLDGFKAINDHFGHSAGDECLRQFARAAQGELRPGDTLARCGGDEFCIILPNTELQEAADIARRVLAASLRHSGPALRRMSTLSASIGVAQWTPDLGATPEPLMAAADHALYQAKHGGKNQVALYQPAPPLVPGFGDAIDVAMPSEPALNR